MNIEELKRLANEATPGPWRAAGEQRNYVDAPIGYGRLQEVARCGDCEVGNKAGNAAYIAAANPAAVLELIRQRDELLAALDAIIALPSHPMRKKAVDIAVSAKAKAEG